MVLPLTRGSSFGGDIPVCLEPFVLDRPPEKSSLSLSRFSPTLASLEDDMSSCPMSSLICSFSVDDLSSRTLLTFLFDLLLTSCNFHFELFQSVLLYKSGLDVLEDLRVLFSAQLPV